MNNSNSNFREIESLPQIGSHRNLQKIEGFATNRLTISKNVLAFLILMNFSLAISFRKFKMRIAL